MPGEWPKARLRDISLVITKGTTPTTLGHKFTDCGINFVKSEAITPDGRIDRSKFAYIDEAANQALKRSILVEDDVLFSMAGVFIGKTAVVPKDILPANTNQAVGIIRLDRSKAEPRYVDYALRNKSYNQFINSLVAQSAQPNLNLAEIGNLPIALPPRTEQRVITHILGTLDDKIEVNRRMNETLEAMARAIFKSWFVDFDPIRAKMEGSKPSGMDAATTTLFPDSFKDSQLGKIPKGWKVGTIGEVSENRRVGIQPDEIEPATPYIGLEHMPQRCIALSEWGHADELESNKFVFKRGDILFGKLRPYFHKVGVAPLDGVCSTDILVVVPKSSIWFAFVLAHVSSVEFVNFVNAASTGTRMPRTNWQDMARYEIPVPPEKIAEALNSRIEPMIARIQSNIMESRTLAATRDALLPKLLSGEIRVKDAEKYLV